ncbi:glycosyltransferase 87 family protein [Amycolatopsis nigrescens]|uniref:glycosyltransferase 87 family protein n=1 Tax=Amycolatopsis nigrescens TaxID=381445 RepID=UPI00035C654B|nr:glycosyltransferase 87 family protein [Amycolatopsis nigrescens]
MRGRWAIWLVLALVVAGFTVRGVLSYLNGLPEGGDTAVYHGGAAALLHGFPLYDSDSLPFEPAYAQLPFTYAPFAALLFVPLVLFPPQVAWGLLNAFSVLCVVLVAYLVLRHLPRRPSWLSPAWGAVVLGLVLSATTPVWVTLEYGQVNALLMALVVVDLLVVCGATGRAGKFGGVLVGVAAATKLTPLIFVVHLLLTGRKADAARAAGTFVGLQGLMLLIAPHDTIRFWTHTVFDSSRIGPTDWTWNQSVGGAVRRLSEQASWSQPVAYAIAAVFAVGGLVLVRHYHRQGRPVSAMLVTAFLALLVSPVSWIHHWVWVVPLAVLLVAESGLGDRLAQVLLPITVAVFLLRPPSWTPGRNGDAPLTAGTFLVANFYLLFVVVIGAVLLVRQRRARVTLDPLVPVRT